MTREIGAPSAAGDIAPSSCSGDSTECLGRWRQSNPSVPHFDSHEHAQEPCGSNSSRTPTELHRHPSTKLIAPATCILLDVGIPRSYGVVR